nr:unnamed protein product [Digitaria exilis]
MGNRARSGGRRRASGGAGGSESKRLRWVADGEEEEEAGAEEGEEGEEEEDADAAEGKMEEEEAYGEDLCFVCKDGGDLRVCDYRSCHKAYHPACVGKDADFLNSDEEFICEWHTCFICEGRSRYYCYCCPQHSFCQGCVAQAEFVPVLRKTKGFCCNCLRMARMVEKNVDVDSDGETADFSDRETYEFLFKEYWEIIRDKEGMTLDKLEEAYAILKKGQICKKDPDLEKLPDEAHHSDDDFVGYSDDEGEELSSRAKLNGTTMKTKSFLKEGKSMRSDFVGWGSKEFIEFLLAIGKDTSETLDQCRAAEVVKDYIRQKGLLEKGRKKNVICDDKLHPLFRKSKVKYNKIYYLLEKHIAANMLSEDETLASSEDNSDSVITKKARNVSYRSSTLKHTPEINKKCFAALVRDNINLIYLRRSLVMDLLKEPDTFERKVIGCFVRIKNDPKDYSFHMHKKLYQLGRVTGIRKTSEEYKTEDILLCISNIPDVKISMLSDEDFDEEECQDLRLLAQNGSFLRYTVGDLEEKARSLRRDIMSHATANNSLKQTPEITKDPNQLDLILLWLVLLLSSEPILPCRVCDLSPSCVHDDGNSTESIVSLRRCSEEKYKGSGEERELSLKKVSEEKSEATNAYTVGGTAVMPTQKQSSEGFILLPVFYLTLYLFVLHTAAKVNPAGDVPGTFVQKQVAKAIDVITIEDDDDDPREKTGQAAVVDLEADDAGDTHHAQHKTNKISRRGHRNGKMKGEASQHMCIWHYIDPQGDEQGPFSMNHLRNWWNNGFFPEDFKIWRTGQTSDTAILLIDALQMTD